MKRESLFCVFLAVCLALLVLSTGCTEQQPAAQGGEVKIGVVASMTGAASTTGKDI